MIRRSRSGAQERAAAATRYRGSTGTVPAKRKAGSVAARRRLVWVLLLALVAEVLLFATRSPWLTVRRVRVTGVASLLPAEVEEAQRAAFVPPGTNLFRADTGQVIRRLQRLPFVERAAVRRRLPPQLDVRIWPRVPVAVVSSPAGAWEVDTDGIVVRARRSQSRLPEVECDALPSTAPGDNAGPTVDAALFTLTHRDPSLRAAVAKIHVDQQANLCLNMVDGIVIRMGQADQLTDKIALIQRIYQEDPGIAAKVQAIDLSCPEAPACTPRAARDEGTDAPRNSDAHHSAPDRRVFRSITRVSQAASDRQHR